MSTDATLTSKGQTTIPKQIRDSLRMKAGDRMTFTLMPDGLVLMRVKSRSVMSVAGRLRKKGRKATHQARGGRRRDRTDQSPRATRDGVGVTQPLWCGKGRDCRSVVRVAGCRRTGIRG
ncbi:MAG: AbrB/MazE/SpoVT family DNA-binding domain-containing protein [Gammaproteobacteria bacterium]|nr:MAG: AbrB/MazE/SpoVT family DNA-binding domain-containing protein [Gammaproteobacteria bacterium]